MRSGSSRCLLFGFNHLVFGGVNGGLEFSLVGLFGVKRNPHSSAHVADLIDVHNTLGLAKNSGEVVAAGLTGETLDLKVSFVTHDFDAVFGDRVFDVGNLHFIGVILDHNGAGLGAGRTMVDAGHGTEGDFGGLSNAFLFKSVDSELNDGAAAIGGTGSGVALAGTGGTFARVFFGSGRFLGVRERSESEE